VSESEHLSPASKITDCFSDKINGNGLNGTRKLLSSVIVVLLHMSLVHIWCSGWHFHNCKCSALLPVFK